MRNLVVLVSGTGSLLQALIDDAARGKVFQISCVISDNSNCAALQRARAAGIDSIGIAHSIHDAQVLKSAGALHAFDSFLDFANSKEIGNLLLD
jgi:folate-dependent phosphoribosylglycinamide formyltransferase PurN